MRVRGLEGSPWDLRQSRGWETLRDDGPQSCGGEAPAQEAPKGLQYWGYQSTRWCRPRVAGESHTTLRGSPTTIGA
jgi:hypothetical protein